MAVATHSPICRFISLSEDILISSKNLKAVNLKYGTCHCAYVWISRSLHAKMSDCFVNELKTFSSCEVKTYYWDWLRVRPDRNWFAGSRLELHDHLSLKKKESWSLFAPFHSYQPGTNSTLDTYSSNFQHSAVWICSGHLELGILFY